MISKFPPNVSHMMCRQMNGECVGWHCSICGQPCGDQGHFDMCKPEDIEAYDAHKKMIASLAVTGRQLLADPDANIDGLLLANLAEQYAEAKPDPDREHDCDEDGETPCSICGYVSGMYDGAP